MMDQMTGGMMWSMGLIGLLVLVLLILGVAALIKYYSLTARVRPVADARNMTMQGEPL